MDDSRPPWMAHLPERTRIERLAEWAYQRGLFLHHVFARTFKAKTRPATVPLGGDAGLKIVSIGNSHIDAAWMWRKNDTRDKKINVTWARSLYHMRKYPAYTFSQNQVVYYAWAKARYPDIYAEIQERAREGRWDVTGGSWVEMDVNIPAGEALVRQFLYGQRWLLREFGHVAPVAWMDDVFGFPASLPQILVKAGCEYFWTNKFCYNDTNPFPLLTFRWRGVDGSEILAHYVQHKNNFAKYLKDYEQFAPLFEAGTAPVLNYGMDLAQFHAAAPGTFVPYLGNFYGSGDGGNGPKPMEILEQLAWARGDAVECGTTRALFDYLARYRGRVPVWADELYLENHRGTLTAIHMIKENNRTAEIVLDQYERLSTIAALHGYEVPRETLKTHWLKALFCAFHDVLPGSSIIEVYRDCARDYQALYEWLHARFHEVLAFLAPDRDRVATPGDETSRVQGVVTFNPASWPRAGVLYLPRNEPAAAEVLELADDGGTRVVVQKMTRLPFVRNRNLAARVEAPTGLDYLRSVDGASALAAWTGLGGSEPGSYYVGRVPGDAPLPPLALTRWSVGLVSGGELTRDQGGVTVVEHDDVVVLANESVEVSINKATGVVDRVSPRDDLASNCLGAQGARLALFEDPKTAFDAWNLHPEYRGHPIALSPVARVTIQETGPVVASALVEYEPTDKNTRLALRVALIGDAPEVYLDVAADWQEEWRLLRFEVDTSLHPEAIHCAIPFAHSARPTNPKTPHEHARWEFPCQSWAFFGDPAARGFRAVTLLDQGKYGTSVHATGFGVSLLKAAQFINYTDAATLDPDLEESRPEFIDRGFHHVPLCLVFHETADLDAETPWRLADAYNAPVLTWEMHHGSDLPAPLHLQESSTSSVSIEALKLAEPPLPGIQPSPRDSETRVVVRLVERAGHATKAALLLETGSLGATLREALEVDLLERGSTRVPHEEDGADRVVIPVTLAAFEIKTLLLVLTPAGPRKP